MKVVFETNTGLEAHMISNLLEQQNIMSRVEGEHLQGGVGDLQAMNFVRVLVNDDDYLQATKIIKEWESQQTPPETTPTSTIKKHFGTTSFLAGIFIGIGCTVWAYNTPVTKEGVDYNNDGILEEKWTYRNNRLVLGEIDQNRDGKIDAIQEYDRRGIQTRLKLDENFDGFFETEIRFKNGNFHYQVSDIDQDGNIDHKIKYKFNSVDEVTIIGHGKPAARKWQKYKMDKLVSAKYDVDGDGKADIAYEYDFFEEIKSKTYLHK